MNSVSGPSTTGQAARTNRQTIEGQVTEPLDWLQWPTAILLTVLIALLPLTLLFNPVLFLSFILEDALGEMTSFTAFSLAGCIFLLRAFDDIRSPKSYWYLLFAVIALFLAGEEISWGQRIVNVATPDFLREINAQGEINLHNLSVTAMQGTYLFITTALFCYGVLLPIAYRLIPPCRRLVDFLGLPVPALVLMPLFAAPVLVWTGPDIARNDEIVELIIAMGMFGIAFYEVGNIKWIARKFHISRKPNVVALLAGFAMCFLVGGLLAQITSFGMPYERQMFSAAKYQLTNSGYVRQAGMVLDHLGHEPAFGNSPLFLVTKGRIDLQQGFIDDGIRSLMQAKKIAIEQLPERQNDFPHLLLLAEIHTLLGELDASQQYANAAFNALDTSQSLEPTQAVGEQDQEKIAMDKIRRGNVYYAVENYELAFDLYLEAATFAQWSSTQLRVTRKLSQVIARCSGRSYEAMTWEEAESLAFRGAGTLTSSSLCQ